MRSGHWSSARKKWRRLRMKWCASTLLSSSNAWIRSRLQRMQLRRQEMRFLGNWRLRKCKDVLRRNFRKICAMSFTLRRGSWLHVHVSKLKFKSAKRLSESYKRPRSSRWDSKLREPPRRSVLRRTSSKSCWRSSQQMSVLSRWTLRREGCASWSIDARSSDFGKRSWRYSVRRGRWKCRSIRRSWLSRRERRR